MPVFSTIVFSWRPAYSGSRLVRLDHQVSSCRRAARISLAGRQTPAERHAATGVSFAIAITPDNTPGAIPQPVVSSDTTIARTATLHPFADELPSETDWVDFVTTRDPQGQAKQLEQQWTWADRRNPSLEQAIPVQFVRQTIIDGTNHDLALATTAQKLLPSSEYYHQQYLSDNKNPRGYCPDHGTGVSCPVGVARADG